MADRSQDWLRQATRDLLLAEECAGSGKHEWACFAAQQSAEKAVKALHLRCGQEAWGHMVAGLLRELSPSVLVPADLIEKAKTLDGFYIPARYPDSYPEGAPFEHFGPLQSEEAIAYAGEIVAFASHEMAGPKDHGGSPSELGGKDGQT